MLRLFGDGDNEVPELRCIELCPAPPKYLRLARPRRDELRCQSCYASAETWKIVGWVIGGFVLLVILLIFALHH